MKYFMIILFFSFSLISEPVKITVEDAIKIGTEENKEIKKTKYENDFIYGKYLEERAQAFPQVSATGYGSKQMDETFYKFSQGLFPKEEDVMGYHLSIDQTIYSWGKIGSAIRAAKLALDSTEVSLNLTKEEIKKIIIEAFYDVIFQKELIEISKENLNQKEEHLREAESKFELGVGTEYDILAAKVNLENAKTNLLKAENGLNILIERLKFILGIDYEIDPVGELTFKEEKIPTFEEGFEIALSQRKELKLQELYEKGRYEFIKIQKSQNKPKVFLSSYFERNNLKTGDYEINASSWNYTLNLSIPLFDGFRTKGSVIEAESEYNKAKLEKEKLIDSIRLEIKTSLYELEEAEKVLRVSEKTKELALRWYEMAKEGYKLGVKTNLDVEDAQLNLSNAKVNLAKAKKDYIISLIKFKKAMGVL